MRRRGGRCGNVLRGRAALLGLLRCSPPCCPPPAGRTGSRRGERDDRDPRAGARDERAARRDRLSRPLLARLHRLDDSDAAWCCGERMDTRGVGVLRQQRRLHGLAGRLRVHARRLLPPARRAPALAERRRAQSRSRRRPPTTAGCLPIRPARARTPSRAPAAASTTSPARPSRRRRPRRLGAPSWAGARKGARPPAPVRSGSAAMPTHSSPASRPSRCG